MENVNFLLLLGTQKCGTTWLGEQMDLHPEFETCKIKEWRSLNEATQASLEDGKILARSDLETIARGKWLSLKAAEKRAYASQNLKNYFSVQCSAATWNTQTKAIGDITGANGLATIEQLQLFKRNAESLGINLKPVYMMRDPVARHVSAAKMRFFKMITDGKPFEENDAQRLEDYMISVLEQADPFYERRAQYGVIIEKIEQVFDRQDILYAFAEDVRKPDAIELFCDFLGISKFGKGSVPEQQHTSDYVNPINYSVSPGTKQKIRNHYSDVYTFIHNRFGDAVPAQWLTAEG